MSWQEIPQNRLCISANSSISNIMFNWFNKLFTRNLNDPSIPINEAWDIFNSGETSYSGESVTNKSATGLPAVYRACNLLAGLMASTKIDILKNQSDGGRVPDKKHPSYKFCKRQTSRWTTAERWRHVTAYQSLLHGNSYTFLDLTDWPNSVEGKILDPESTTPVLENGNLFYVTQLSNGRQLRLTPDEVLHIRSGLGESELVGWSLIDLLRHTFGHAQSLRKHSQVLFRNGGRPRIVLEFPGAVSPEKSKEILEGWQRNYGGLDNAGKTALLPNGGAASTISVSNEDQQFLETYRYVDIQIASALGIPSHLVGADTATSYGSLIEENRGLLVYTLNPIFASWESELWLKLLTTEQQDRDSHYFEFNRQSLLQADPQTQSDIALNELNSGGISEEQYFRMQNRPATKDGTFRRPSNVVIEEWKAGERQDGPRGPAGPQDGPDASQGPQDGPDGPADGPDGPRGPQDGPRGPAASQDGPAAAPAERCLQTLTEATVAKLKARLAKSGDDPTNHSDIILRSLDAFDTFTVNEWLADVATEWRAVLPEQRTEVIDRIDTTAVAKRMINGTSL